MAFLLANVTEDTILPRCGTAILFPSFPGAVLAWTLLLLRGLLGRTWRALLMWRRHVGVHKWRWCKLLLV
jgi:hypothetical protein